MLSLSANPKFSKLMAVYLLWLLSCMLAATLFEVYFFNLGLSLMEIYLANSLWFVASLVLIPLFRGFRSRDFMLAGIAVAFLPTALLYCVPDTGISYVFRLLVGGTNLLFWAPFNVLFYEFRKENHASLGALYYSLGPILSVFVPPVAVEI